MPDTQSLQQEIARIDVLITSLREMLPGDILEGDLLPLNQGVGIWSRRPGKLAWDLNL
jgi:hypothetical protein